MHVEIITLRKKNINDFARERNLLLKKSKAEWVLFLDYDEVMPAELKKEIDRLNPDGFKGFYIFRKNYFLGKPIGTDKILRLAKKDSSKWSRKVHEVWTVNGKIGTLKNPIIHTTAKNLTEYISKINYYSTLHAEENFNSGKLSSLFKIIFYPPAKFLQSLVMGRGFVFSMLQSFHSFLAWSKEYFL
ncbi:MAG TPA: hypothetical protein VKC54_03245 [Patescibacteria group bacterium]|nr:hypothetical protein [Patescibacteria group bacterium]